VSRDCSSSSLSCGQRASGAWCRTAARARKQVQAATTPSKQGQGCTAAHDSHLGLSLRGEPLYQVKLEPCNPGDELSAPKSMLAASSGKGTHCRISGAAFSLIHACRSSAKSVCKPPSGAAGGSSRGSSMRACARGRLPRGGGSAGAAAGARGCLQPLRCARSWGRTRTLTGARFALSLAFRGGQVRSIRYYALNTAHSKLALGRALPQAGPARAALLAPP